VLETICNANRMKKTAMPIDVEKTSKLMRRLGRGRDDDGRCGRDFMSGVVAGASAKSWCLERVPILSKCTFSISVKSRWFQSRNRRKRRVETDRKNTASVRNIPSTDGRQQRYAEGTWLRLLNVAGRVKPATAREHYNNRHHRRASRLYIALTHSHTVSLSDSVSLSVRAVVHGRCVVRVCTLVFSS